MKPFLSTRDYAYSKEEFQLLLDKERKMLVTHPQPKNLAPYYEGQNYISHTDEGKGIINRCYQVVKRYSLRRKIKLLRPYISKGEAILDIGAGTGSFVLAARRSGYNAFGVEPNEGARQIAAQKGAAMYGSLDAIETNRYSVITLWHVLEHLPNLEEQISRIISRLDEGGTLVLALPNYRSWDAGYFKEYWAAYDVPRHLWHFSRDSIAKIFDPLGFQVVLQKPMPFDAFYIAMLSLRYKNGRNNLLKGFFLGMWSNIAAWRTGEYSSVIYVLQGKKIEFTAPVGRLGN
jgi:SAM-dependent methyltransferase